MLDWYNEASYKAGELLFVADKVSVRRTLRSFMLEDGVLDGSKMQEHWFPQVEADIFISHSHKDEKKAIALSGWLHTTFGLKAFVDSCIWGYADDLLEKIDRKYCYNEEEGYFNYRDRNYSTSHVHMMLNTALMKMMDKTECLFFLNTPESLSANDVINKPTTHSPWIYSEIATSQIIRQSTPRRRTVEDTRYFAKGGRIDEQLRIRYEMDLRHLTEINIDDMIEWQDNGRVKGVKALDVFYELNPLTMPIL